MIKLFILLLAAMPVFKDYKSLNHKAEQEYQQPIRPGYAGRNPFWNGFSPKFIYVPAFDFKTVNGAVKYRFTATFIDAFDKAHINYGKIDENAVKKQADGRTMKTWSFVSTNPQSTLAPIWNKMPVGNYQLRVEGLDKNSQVVGVSGERTFLRDFPFQGPYHEAERPFDVAAKMALLYIHQMPAVQHWLTSTMPDMEYKHNTYPNKIIGATVRAEVRVAKLFPEMRESALSIARNAAQFLINQSRPNNEKLAGFPPTYYGGLIASKHNEGLIMTMDPCMAATAFLDLYDYTKEEIYKDKTIRILDTYASLQRADGSMPIKLNVETGEPVNESCAMLTPLMNLIRLVQKNYNVHAYDKMLAKAEKWMNEVALETFNLTGQFEDVTVDVVPYQNLTNCTAAPYASYLLSQSKPSAKDIQDARDLIALSEDQFVHWDFLPMENGIKRIAGPCVFEQYKYQTPVDASSCNVANALISLYEVTGDKLALAKAVTLMNALTIVQNSMNGMMPTTFQYQNYSSDAKRTFWVNCSVATITTWMRLHELLNKKK